MFTLRYLCDWTVNMTTVYHTMTKRCKWCYHKISTHWNDSFFGRTDALLRFLLKRPKFASVVTHSFKQTPCETMFNIVTVLFFPIVYVSTMSVNFIFLSAKFTKISLALPVWQYGSHPHRYKFLLSIETLDNRAQEH